MTARDGSPVELYARMPTFGEPEIVHAAIPPGAEILELGSGAGRMTHRLVELGHRVTAVDNSAEMLSHVRGAETVHAEIAELALDRRFACVLLASNLVNSADEERAALLAACTRHVADDGVVIIQRYDPEWAEDPRPSDSVRDGLRIRVIGPRREGRRLTASVEYELGGLTWRHGPFTSTILDDAELRARLDMAGLRFDRWLDDRRTWLVAKRSGDVSALWIDAPNADVLVAETRLAHDPSAAAGVPAHVTILYPFVAPETIDGEVDAGLRAVAATVEPFEVRFARTGRFPSVLWLEPDPAEPFARLTAAAVERWPVHPPYGGTIETVVHHLTVADGAPDEVLNELDARVSAGLPVADAVKHLTLGVRRAGTWSVEGRYPLGRIGHDG